MSYEENGEIDIETMDAADRNEKRKRRKRDKRQQDTETEAEGAEGKEEPQDHLERLLEIQDKTAMELAKASSRALNFSRNKPPRQGTDRHEDEKKNSAQHERLQEAMAKANADLEAIMKARSIRALLQAQMNKVQRGETEQGQTESEEQGEPTTPEGQDKDNDDVTEDTDEEKSDHTDSTEEQEHHIGKTPRKEAEEEEREYQQQPKPRERTEVKSLAGLPTFKGKEITKIADHLTAVDCWAKVYRYADSTKPRLLLYSLLEGDPASASWFSRYLDEHPETNWDEAKEVVAKHYEPSNAKQITREQVLDCKQRTNEDVQKYTTRFTNLLHNAKMDTTEAFVITTYVRGLRTRLEERVKLEMARNSMKDPVGKDNLTLKEVAVMAQALEPFVTEEEVCTICGERNHKAGPTCPVVAGRLEEKMRQADDTRIRANDQSRTCYHCKGKGWNHHHPAAECHFKSGRSCTSCKENDRWYRHSEEDCPKKGKPELEINHGHQLHAIKHTTRTQVTVPEFFAPVLQDESEADLHTDALTTVVRVDNSALIQAEVDPGASTTYITEDRCKQLNLKIKPHRNPIKLANSTVDWSIGLTQEVRIQCGAQVVMCKMVVMRKLDGSDIFLGRPQLIKLGMLKLHIPLFTPAKGETAEVPSDMPTAPLEPQPYHSDHERRPRVPELHTEDEVQHDKIMANLGQLLKHNDRLTGFAKVKPVRLNLAVETPKWIPPYGIAESHKPAVRQQVEQWEQNGKIERINDSHGWNNPINAQPKYDKAGKVCGTRICFDARGPNKTMLADRFPIPNPKTIFNSFKGNTIFAEIDLSDAFLQLELDERDRDITAFTFEGTQYRFKGCPYGLKIMSNVFQRKMSQIFRDLPFVKVYIDNLMLASRDWEEHEQHVRAVIQRCNEYNIKISVKKLLIGRRAITMLGMKIDQNGIAPDTSKVESIRQWPFPADVKAMQSFLGVVNFVRPHLRHLADLEAPLNRARVSKAAYEREVQHNLPAMEEAFSIIKEAIAQAPILVYPDFMREFHLALDASRNGIGAVLYQTTHEQDQNGDTSIKSENIVAISSRALNKHERHYPVYKLETLAIVHGLKEYHDYLYGRQFHMYTDHRSLAYLLKSNNNNNTLRSWLDIIQTYNFTIQHVPGYLNALPDALSRLYTGTTAWGVPEHKLHALLENKKVANKAELMDLMGIRIPPESERAGIVQKVHDQGHYGINAVAAQIYEVQRCWWPNLRNDIATHVSQCSSCQKYTVYKRGYHPQRSPHASLPMDHWQIDLVQLPTSQMDNEYMLVITDLFTSYAITRAMRTKTAEETARHIYQVFGDWGPPRTVQCDQGKEFLNKVFTELNKLAGVDLKLTSPYHHAANGRVERLNQTIVRSLKKMLSGALATWDTILPLVTHYYNISVRTLTKSSPYSLMFTREHNIGTDEPVSQWKPAHQDLKQWIEQHQKRVLQDIYPTVDDMVQNTRAKQAKKADDKHRPQQQLEVGVTVMARNLTKASKHEQDWLGPYKVKEVTSTGSYILTDGINNDIRRARQDMKRLRDSKDEHNDEVYEVETILDHRMKGIKKEYLVKWKGFSSKDNTWEPESNFRDDDIVKKYWKNQRSLVPSSRTRK